MKKPERMDAFFNKRYNNYDEHMRKNVASFNELYTKIAEPILSSEVRQEVLVLGCGTGLELEAIFRKLPKAKIIGIDLSTDMLSKLSEKYAARMKQIELINESYTEYPFQENRFDYAVSVMTMHHLLENEKREVYQKIHRALKPGGFYVEGDYVVSDEKSREFLEKYNALKVHYGIEEMSQYHVDIPFTRQKQELLFKESGFDTVDIVFESGDAFIFKNRKKCR